MTSVLFRRVFSLAAVVLLSACGASTSPSTPPSAPAPSAPAPSAPAPSAPAPSSKAEPTADALLRASWSDSDGFEPMPEAQPGEWLARFDESHVPFDDYTAGDPVRADGERRILAFVPAGRFEEYERTVMEATIEFCGLWFDLPTATLPEMEVDAGGLSRSMRNARTDSEYEQIHTAYFLRQQLPRRLPDEAVTLVAVTMRDLYPGDGWNYVFGQALLRGRVGVYSLARHFPAFWGEPDTMEARRQALRRSLKLVSHEVGHTFGLEHCVTWRCNMNGSNSLSESDRAPLHLCPGCLRKMQWNRGFDVMERYEKLRAFFEKYDLSDEAAWIEARMARIREAASVSR